MCNSGITLCAHYTLAILIVNSYWQLGGPMGSLTKYVNLQLLLLCFFHLSPDFEPPNGNICDLQ